MARGRLRIYLGAAPGVGKTYAMLNEGRRRHDRGTDVVVGLAETHGRPNTSAQLGDLEVIPRRRVRYRDREFEEMDTEAIIARKPAQVLVDELAHTNVPGSRNEKRWQDVDEILDAGIDVISTLNIQHLESVNDLVERITGIKQHETIPDAKVRVAEQVELVDMTPEALRRRMAHGNIYPAERVDAALANYFRPGNLAALRELALLWVADRVDDSLQQYMEDHGIDASWETRERVVVALTGAVNGDDLIRRAARMAQRTRGDLIGVHIRNTSGLAERRDDARLTEHRQLLEALGGKYHEVAGDDVGRALVEFAKAEHATQLVIGATRRSRWNEMLRGSIVARVIRESDTIDVHVISGGAADEPESPVVVMPRPAPGLSGRRELTAWAIAALGLPVLTVIMTSARGSFSLATALLVYVLLVVAVAGVGGLRPGVTSSLFAFVLADYFFIPPLHEFAIHGSQDVIALVALLLVGFTVSGYVTVAARRAMEAAHAKAEARTLAQLSGSVIGAEDPLAVLMAQVRQAFDVTAAAVLRQEGDGWRVETSAGEPVPTRPEDADLTVPLDEDELLVLVGPALDHEDLALLEAFTGQLSLALESRQLRAEAALATGLAEANQLRTALLAAVSHDLRTPLSSIKASVTSLLQQDVEWPPDAQRDLLEAIDRGADRLTGLISNLLDMGRLQTGTFDLVQRDVGLEEVVPQVVAELPPGRVTLDLPETLPRVHADASLLERAIANVLENAVQWSPPDQLVRVEAGCFGDNVDLRVVDVGPGVRPDQREEIFRPFQRLGDSSNTTGVGLGLAVARGFVEAMGGSIAVEDTPGGGLTLVVSLPRADR